MLFLKVIYLLNKLDELRDRGDLVADNVLLINAYVWAKNSNPTLEATYSC
nr:MAG TPA: hypothetical protein [Caudoviricetes sp.]